MKKLIAIVFLMASTSGFSVDHLMTIERIKTYDSGEIHVTPGYGPGNCNWLWIDGSQPGAKNMLSVLLAAKAMSKTVTVGVLATVRQPGNSDTCKIITVNMTP